MPSDSSNSCHPSSSRLPRSPSPSDVAAFLDQLLDFRRSLWPLASSPQGKVLSRRASRVRAVLGEAETDLNALFSALDALAAGSLVPVQDVRDLDRPDVAD